MSAELIAAYVGGSIAQAALVGAAGAAALPAHGGRWRHPLVALVPVASLVGVVVLVRLHPQGATAVAHVALVGVPALALLAAARLGKGALALTVAATVAAFAAGGSLVGQLAALALIGASCLVLGALLAALAPPRSLRAGVVAMAAADLALVAGGVLGPASDVLNAAAAADDLPRFQRVELGPLTMGYGDLFLPAVVGALLATRGRPRAGAAALTLGFALAAGLVFLAVDRLPATVPVALALLVVEASRAWPPVAPASPSVAQPPRLRARYARARFRSPQRASLHHLRRPGRELS